MHHRVSRCTYASRHIGCELTLLRVFEVPLHIRRARSVKSRGCVRVCSLRSQGVTRAGCIGVRTHRKGGSREAVLRVSGLPLFCEVCCGGVLLSHTLPGAVPSALAGLASRFGMEAGRFPAAMTTTRWFNHIHLNAPECVPRVGRGGLCWL